MWREQIKSLKPKLLMKSFLGVLVFVFLCIGQNSVNDNDGNTYATVTIGNQIWAANNLRTTKYRDGTEIRLVTNSKAWSKLTTPAYCWYNNDIRNKEKYGALYNWYAVETQRLSPSGWHVASVQDWNTLKDYLIANGYNYDGKLTGNKIAKSLAANIDWFESANTGAIGNDLSKNNRSGFTALPSGFRVVFGHFDYLGNIGGYWWCTSNDSSSMPYSCKLLNYKNNLNISNGLNNLEYKCYGFSIRIIKD